MTSTLVAAENNWRCATHLVVFVTLNTQLLTQHICVRLLLNTYSPLLPLFFHFSSLSLLFILFCFSSCFFSFLFYFSAFCVRFISMSSLPFALGSSHFQLGLGDIDFSYQSISTYNISLYNLAYLVLRVHSAWAVFSSFC